jgi:hypothetical protein
MICKSNKNSLAIINKGMYKDNICIILKKCVYINTEKLKYYTVYQNKTIMTISNNSLTLL